MSNGTTLRPANRCRMASWRASTADCVTSASTSTCSPTSRRHARSSKNGGSTTTPTDRTRALTGLHRLSSQHAPHQGITGTDSPYKRGQVGEQVNGFGAKRGTTAHQPAILHQIDPKDDLNTVRQIVAGIRAIDRILNKL